jgi:homocitrate synthase NifV
VLGKHSGGNAVRAAYAALGIALDAIAAGQLLAQIRAHAVATKRAPEVADLLRFYRELTLEAA